MRRVWYESYWNVAEAVLAFGSVATIFPGESSGRLVTGRPFRFMRVFRIIRFVAGLRNLARTLALSLPSMMSIIGLMAITTFLYASKQLSSMAHPRTYRPRDGYG